MKYNKKTNISQLKKNKKSKKNIQKGGAVSAANINNKSTKTKNHITKAFSYTEDMPNITALFKKYFSDHTKFKPDTNLKVPFITDIQNMSEFTTDYYYNWYVDRNPTFANIIEYKDEKPIQKIQFDTTCQIKDANGELETHYIYEPLIAQICRDVLIILIKESYIEGDEKLGKDQDERITKIDFNDSNVNQNNNILDELFGVLKMCEDCISGKYNYLSVCLIFIKLIYLLSTNLIKYNDFYKNKHKNSLSNIKQLYSDIFNKPFIFFPTHQQLSYQSQVLLKSSPIINFRLNNRFRLVHGLLYSPYRDFSHDVHNHAKRSQYYSETNTVFFKQWFQNLALFIKILSEYFFDPPKKKQTYTNIINSNTSKVNNITAKDKRMCSFVLFALLHEGHKHLCSIILPKLLEEKTIKFEPNFEARLKKEQKGVITRHLIFVASVDRLDSVIKYEKPDWYRRDWTNVIDYFCSIIHDKLSSDKSFEESIIKLIQLYDDISK